MARPGVNEWALVTGASGGLGAELARAVAAQGRSVVLTARSEASLRALAAEIGREHGVDAAVEPLDLSDEGSAAELQARLDARGIAPDLLVANAGFGLSGPFLENDPMRLRAMLQLNVVSLTELSWSLGRRMAAGRGGRILMVASLAAYQPCPNLAAYGASKAYILSVGEALDAELAPAVRVTVLSPGLMDTGFNAASGFRTPPGMQRLTLPPARVAAIGLQALDAGRSSIVAGRVNKLMAFSSRLMSRRRAARISLSLAQSAEKTHG